MVSHTDIQSALSARIDGEEAGVDSEVVEAHLAQCPECSAYWERSLALSRSLARAGGDAALDPPEDLSDVILAGVQSEFQRVSSRRIVALALARIMLVCLSVVHVIWAGRFLVSAGQIWGADQSAADQLFFITAVHVSIAGALLFVSWKPGQVPGVLLLVGAIFGFSLGFAVLDSLAGITAPPWGQLLTLLVTALSLVFMWIADKGLAATNPLRALSAKPQQ